MWHLLRVLVFCWMVVPRNEAQTEEIPEIFKKNRVLTTHYLYSPEKPISGVRIVFWENISDEEFRNIILECQKLPLLQFLSIEGAKVSTESLSYLSKLSGNLHLITLNILSCKGMTDEVIPRLASLRSLQQLSLAGCPIAGKGLSALKSLCSLRQISLEGTNIGAEGMSELGSLQSLTYIGLKNTKIVDSSISNLSTIHGLTALDLEMTQITGQGIRTLSGLKLLMSLTIPSSAQTDQDLEGICECKSLINLNLLGDSKITDLGMRHIGKLKDLQTLFLGKNPITNNGIKELSTLKSLRELSLRSHQVDHEGLKALIPLQKLLFLRMPMVHIGKDEIQALSEMKQLVLLEVNPSGLTDEQRAVLKKAIPQLVIQITKD